MGLMQFKRPPELDAVLAPKIAGTRALAEALRIGEPGEIELDFLALFSSITSATGGGPGQVDYCAANAYLDGYAAPGRDRPQGRLDRLGRVDLERLGGGPGATTRVCGPSSRRTGPGSASTSTRAAARCCAPWPAREPRVIVSTQDFETVVTGSAPVQPGGGDRARRRRRPAGDRHPRPSWSRPTRSRPGRRRRPSRSSGRRRLLPSTGSACSTTSSSWAATRSAAASASRPPCAASSPSPSSPAHPVRGADRGRARRDHRGPHLRDPHRRRGRRARTGAATSAPSSAARAWSRRPPGAERR